MKKLRWAFLALALANGSLWAADKYEIDPVHSVVGFTVKHLMVSNVKGQFTDYAGVIMYDEKDVTKSSIDVTIQAASINTANAKRDEHLKSAEFFDVAKFPTLTFKSNKIEKRAAGTVAVGTLTIKGVSKEIELPFTVNGVIKDPWGNTKLGAEASTAINRQDFGITWNKSLDGGGVVVSDEVKIQLDIEAGKSVPAKKK